jgi:hypothetical protein
MTLAETREVLADDGPAERYAGISAEVLLLHGAGGPPYYAELGAALARALPRARSVPAPGGHDAIAVARPRLVDVMTGLPGRAGIRARGVDLRPRSASGRVVAPAFRPDTPAPVTPSVRRLPTPRRTGTSGS